MLSRMGIMGEYEQMNQLVVALATGTLRLLCFAAHPRFTLSLRCNSYNDIGL